MASEKLARLDLLWMDIQGAELMALKGLDERLGHVSLIHTEVEFLEIYSEAPLFAEIKSYLNRNGFLLVGFTNFGTFSGDAVFVNKSLLTGGKRLHHLIVDKLAYPAQRLLSTTGRLSGRLRRLLGQEV